MGAEGYKSSSISVAWVADAAGSTVASVHPSTECPCLGRVRCSARACKMC